MPFESYRQKAAIYDELVRDRPDDEKLLNRRMWSHAKPRGGIVEDWTDHVRPCNCMSKC